MYQKASAAAVARAAVGAVRADALRGRRPPAVGAHDQLAVDLVLAVRALEPTRPSRARHASSTSTSEVLLADLGSGLARRLDQRLVERAGAAGRCRSRCRRPAAKRCMQRDAVGLDHRLAAAGGPAGAQPRRARRRAAISATADGKFTCVERVSEGNARAVDREHAAAGVRATRSRRRSRRSAAPTTTTSTLLSWRLTFGLMGATYGALRAPGHPAYGGQFVPPWGSKPLSHGPLEEWLDRPMTRLPATTARDPARQPAPRPPRRARRRQRDRRRRRPGRGAARARAARRIEDMPRAGRACSGAEERSSAGFAANEHPPEHVVLRPLRRAGRRRSPSTLPGTHVLRLAVEHGVAGAPWADPRPGRTRRARRQFIVVAQVEAGIDLPAGDDLLVRPALRLRTSGRRRLGAARDQRDLRPARRCRASQKRGALIGMALTERSGGSDVRAGTIAEPLPDGDEGDCWSAARSGSSRRCSPTRSSSSPRPSTGCRCLLVPRRDEDGTPTASTSTGSRTSSATAPTRPPRSRFTARAAALVGEEGRGVRAIMAMIGGTRHDCVLGSTAVMRLGTAEAIHWADHRGAFGRRARRPARDDAPCWPTSRWRPRRRPPARCAWRAPTRRPTPATARRRCSAGWPRRCSSTGSASARRMHAAEALECQGGYGYIEESRLARCLPRGAADVDLGGLGQCAGARRAARAGAARPNPLDAAPGRARPGLRRRRLDWTPPWPACAPSSRGRRRRGAARAVCGRLARALPAGLAARAPRPAGGGRRLLRRAPGRAAPGAPSATLPAGRRRSRRSSSAPDPSPPEAR